MIENSAAGSGAATFQMSFVSVMAVATKESKGEFRDMTKAGILFGVAVLSVLAAYGATHVHQTGGKGAKNALNEFFNMGTFHGLEKCFEINKSEIVPERSVRQNCLERLTTEIPMEQIVGTAYIENRDPLFLSVDLENRSKEYTMLRAVVSVHYFESGKNSSLSSNEFWILEPEKKHSKFLATFDGDIAAVGDNFWCEIDSDVRENCAEWTIKAFGVSLD